MKLNRKQQKELKFLRLLEVDSIKKNKIEKENQKGNTTKEQERLKKLLNSREIIKGINTWLFSY